MYFCGEYVFDKTHWFVEIPALGVQSQGFTPEDAMVMVCDAVMNLVNEDGFVVEAYRDPSLGERNFRIKANNPDLLALFHTFRESIGNPDVPVRRWEDVKAEFFERT